MFLTQSGRRKAIPALLATALAAGLSVTGVATSASATEPVIIITESGGELTAGLGEQCNEDTTVGGNVIYATSSNLIIGDDTEIDPAEVELRITRSGDGTVFTSVPETVGSDVIFDFDPVFLPEDSGNYVAGVYYGTQLLVDLQVGSDCLENPDTPPAPTVVPVPKGKVTPICTAGVPSIKIEGVGTDLGSGKFETEGATATYVIGNGTVTATYTPKKGFVFSATPEDGELKPDANGNVIITDDFSEFFAECEDEGDGDGDGDGGGEVVPANPKAELPEYCQKDEDGGSVVEVKVTNPLPTTETTDFTVTINGKLAVKIEDVKSGETRVERINFTEDNGVKHVKVLYGDKVLAYEKVSTDCLPNEEPAKPAVKLVKQECKYYEGLGVPTAEFDFSNPTKHVLSTVVEIEGRDKPFEFEIGPFEDSVKKTFYFADGENGGSVKATVYQNGHKVAKVTIDTDCPDKPSKPEQPNQPNQPNTPDKPDEAVPPVIPSGSHNPPAGSNNTPGGSNIPFLPFTGGMEYFLTAGGIAAGLAFIGLAIWLFNPRRKAQAEAGPQQ